jgi:chromosome segregation ATPase
MFSSHSFADPPPSTSSFFGGGSGGGDDDDDSFGIHKVAEQIRERALQVVQEQAIEAIAKQEVDKLESIVQQARVEHHRERQRLLEARTACDGVELEHGRLVEQHEERKRKSSKIQKEMNDMEQQAQVQQKMWDETVDGIFSQHRIQRQLFTNILEQQIRIVEHAKKTRQDRMQLVMAKTEQLRQDAESCQAQTSCIQQHLLPKAKADREADNQHVQQLAGQVRTALARRTELRAALRQAQKLCEEADASMVQAENEYMSKSSAGTGTRER